MNLGLAIRTRRRSLGLRQADLAQAADVTPAAIGNIENGSRKPSIDVFVRIASKLQTTPNDLLDGTDLYTDFVPPSTRHVHKSPPLSSKRLNPAQLSELLPHLHVSASAQAGELTPYFEEEWREECEAVRLPGIEGEAYLLNIIGDSMEPLFHEGDLAVVVPSTDDRDLTMNRLVAAVTGGSGVLIKVLRAHKMSGGVILGSLNPAYSDIHLDRDDTYKMFLVIGKWTTRLNLDGMPSRERGDFTEMRQMMLDMQARLSQLERGKG